MLRRSIERLRPDLRWTPASRLTRSGKKALIVRLVPHVVNLTSVEARWIGRFGDRSKWRTCHRLHLRVGVIRATRAVRRNRVALTPHRDATVARHRRAARKILLLECLATRLVHPQHPGGAMSIRSSGRKEKVF